MNATQENRIATISTVLGRDVLLLRSVSIREEISRMFQIEAELSSTDGNLNSDQLLGSNVTIEFRTESNQPRSFNAFVSRFVQVANASGYAQYRAILVPWLWFLTRSANCRIFQNKSIPDIIEEIFKTYGGNYRLKLSGSYTPREYCVQYRETDFNFVCRLMEQEGIYFYFEHSKGKHDLILADAPGAHKVSPGHGEMLFTELQTAAADAEGIIEWTMEKEVEPGVYSLNDYNFQKSRTPLFTSAAASHPHARGQYEIYDYPGDYESVADGDRVAQNRLDELKAQYEVLRGKATSLGIATGCKFKLKGHPRDDQNQEYLITGVSFYLHAGEYASAGGRGEFFNCDFQAIPFSQTFRSPRITPKPVVQGPQTAVVTGPQGEEVYVDKYGRVKVQFYWDRQGKKDENSSCFIRVSQVWAGKNWGAIYTPRIGQEVIVEFLEGDPDRPIITGRVYNDAAMPPYSLPEKKTVSTIKSNSTKGGQGSNEIRFEDKKGDEELFIHAEKNKKVIVENDRNEEVGRDETIKIGSDRTQSVGANEKISIGKSRTEDVGGDESISINGNRTKSVEKDERITVEGARTIDIKKSETTSVGENRTETVEKDESLTVKKNRVVKVEENHEQNVGKKFALIAGEQIQLQTGDASIILKKSGTIEIKGKDIKISGSGKITVKADSDVVLKGSAVKTN